MKSIKECATIHIETLPKSMDISAKCVFFEKDGIFHITYTEPKEVGTNGSRVFIKIAKDSVSVRRMGEFKSVFHYETGKLTDTCYQTPYGKMDIKIYTKRIIGDISKDGGRLKISYAVKLGAEETENEIHLEIKKEN
ncbi:MAG: DUF1934 domain-containing protein [Clostridia bacterium]|nr:DUF1934 domain-containing protein [Clostridia bacterium]